MKPVEIDITTSRIASLKAECARLGITVGVNASAHSCRKKLRAYKDNYTLCVKWKKLAEALFGQHHRVSTTTLDSLVDGVNYRLYTRLAQDGYVAKPNQDIKLLRDTANNRHLVILGRQNKRVLNVRIYNLNGTKATPPVGTCAIIYAARLAFPDVDAAVTQWEQPRSEPEPEQEK